MSNAPAAVAQLACILAGSSCRTDRKTNAAGCAGEPARLQLCVLRERPVVLWFASDSREEYRNAERVSFSLGSRYQLCKQNVNVLRLFSSGSTMHWYHLRS